MEPTKQGGANTPGSSEGYEDIEPDLLALYSKMDADERNRRLLAAVERGELARVRCLMAAGADPRALMATTNTAGKSTGSKGPGTRHQPRHTTALLCAQNSGNQALIQLLGDAPPSGVSTIKPEKSASLRGSFTADRVDTGLVPSSQRSADPSAKGAPTTVGTSSHSASPDAYWIIAGESDENTIARWRGKPAEELQEALARAVTEGRYQATRLMLDAGADPRAEPEDLSILELAATHHDPAIAQLLISRGAKVYLREVCEAVVQGNIRTAELLLQNYCDPSDKQMPWAMALKHAASSEQERMVEWLLANGASPAQAIAWMAEDGDSKSIRLLMKHGVMLSDRNAAGETALSLILRARHANGLHNLVHWGLVIDAKTPGAEQALKLAAKANNDALVMKLCDNGVRLPGGKLPPGFVSSPVEVPEDESVVTKRAVGVVTPTAQKEAASNDALHRAAAAADLPKLHELLAAGANLMALDREVRTTVLHAAAEAGDDKLVELLIQHGIYVNVTSADGKTALHRAAHQGHAQTVERLLAAGADIHLADQEGATALHRAAQHGHGAAAEILIGKRAALEETTKYGTTALHVASRNADQPLVSSLIRGKASIDAVDGSGATSLIRAAGAGKHSNVELLLKSKAAIGARTKHGETALYQAAKSGHAGVVELLLKEGAAIDAADDYGNTPLHTAAHQGRTAIVALLLQYKASAQAKNQLGETPLTLAIERGHRGAAALLTEAGGT